MRKIVTTVLALIGIIVLASGSFGQQASAYKPDGWQGLTLDESTPEDAIRTLGQPISDKLDRLLIHNIDKWITPKHKQKIFRVLTYKSAGGVKRAELAFLDNKLVRIYIEYEEKKFPAKDLREKFGVDFVFVEGQVPSNSTPWMYGAQKESLAPKAYPAAYYMVSVTPQSLISAFVARGGIKGALGQAYRVKKKEPGSLYHLDIISRTLAKGEHDNSLTSSPR
jgi:hypothetical protein